MDMLLPSATAAAFISAIDDIEFKGDMMAMVSAIAPRVMLAIATGVMAFGSVRGLGVCRI